MYTYQLMAAQGWVVLSNAPVLPQRVDCTSSAPTQPTNFLSFRPSRLPPATSHPNPTTVPVSMYDNVP